MNKVIILNHGFKRINIEQINVINTKNPLNY